MGNTPKVIILIPTYNHAIFLEHCLQRLKQLEPQPDKYIFLENNSTDDTLEVIQEFDRPKELIRMWFRDDAVKHLGNPYEVIGIARQYLLKRARQLDPDFAIFIDDDIVMMYKHFIDQITGRKRDIVGAPYFRPFSMGFFLASKWKRKGKRGLWFKESCQGFQETYITSAGCLCLSRKIIQDKRVNFLPIIWGEKKDGKRASEDFGYCIKAQKLGYKVYLDCTLKVGHYATADDYKPWMIKRDEKGKVIGYIDFKFG